MDKAVVTHSASGFKGLHHRNCQKKMVERVVATAIVNHVSLLYSDLITTAYYEH